MKNRMPTRSPVKTGFNRTSVELKLYRGPHAYLRRTSDSFNRTSVELKRRSVIS